MAKAGRKRKAGTREPNGRVQRPTVDRLNEMTAASRRKEQQTVLDQPHRQGIRDKHGDEWAGHAWAESPLGRFCIRHKLRHEYYDAGLAYASIVSCWRGAKGVPHSATKGDGGSCAEGPDEDAVARWQKQMIGIETVMRREGINCFLAVRTLVLDVGDIGLDQDRAALAGLFAVAVELGTLRAGDRPMGV